MGDDQGQRLLEGPLDPHEALQVGLQLCRALAAVHGAGLVHGDVKAANVLREQGGRVVLADLGSGAELGRSDPGGAVFVSPLSTAPEVLEGASPSPAADLYSLGALLYQLLAGRHPVEAEDLDGLRERPSSSDSRPVLGVLLLESAEDGHLRSTAAPLKVGQGPPYDHYGAAVAVGDFNGDGYDDLAIGVP